MVSSFHSTFFFGARLLFENKIGVTESVTKCVKVDKFSLIKKKLVDLKTRQIKSKELFNHYKLTHT